MALAFATSMIIKALINQDLNWTLYIELPVLVIAAILEFSLSVMLSIGTSNDFYKNPYSQKERATAAKNSVWFAFLFIFIALVITIIRLTVFLRRRKKEVIPNTLEKEEGYDEPKAI